MIRLPRMSLRRLATIASVLVMASCASTTTGPRPYVAADSQGWREEPFTIRPTGLGMAGGAELARGVTFAGGVEVQLEVGSPLHSLSDLKLTGDGGFVSVSDTGDLAKGRIVLDGAGRLTGVEAMAVRRLTLADGSDIVEKYDGDAEGLLLTPDGDLIVSFERNHRLWNYGPLTALNARPVALRHPDFPFPENDGMEGVAAGPDGSWRVSGESGGVWDCRPAACTTVVAPPETPIPNSDFRITGMDRDPSGQGWFVVQRLFRMPIDARAQVRRMAPDGTLGPVLVTLKLPGLTDNFEGVAAETRNGRTRLYILSDDNGNPVQKTLLLAFDVAR